jgi:hypothetical protein
MRSYLLSAAALLVLTQVAFAIPDGDIYQDRQMEPDAPMERESNPENLQKLAQEENGRHASRDPQGTQGLTAPGNGNEANTEADLQNMSGMIENQMRQQVLDAAQPTAQPAHSY